MKAIIERILAEGKMEEGHCYMEMVNPEKMEGMDDKEKVEAMCEMAMGCMNKHTSKDMSEKKIAEMAGKHLMEMMKRY